MEIIALSILILSSILGFLFIFFTNFGTTIIICGCITYAILTKFTVLTALPLFSLIILYVCGEIIEYVCIVIGAKKFGASNKAIIGAIIGGIIGAVAGIALFGIGVFLGTILGIFFGAFIVEKASKKSLIQSVKAGAGGVIGRFGAIAAKVVIAIIMFIIVGFQIFTYSF